MKKRSIKKWGLIPLAAFALSVGAAVGVSVHTLPTTSQSTTPSVVISGFKPESSTTSLAVKQQVASVVLHAGEETTTTTTTTTPTTTTGTTGTGGTPSASDSDWGTVAQASAETINSLRINSYTASEFASNQNLMRQTFTFTVGWTNQAQPYVIGIIENANQVRVALAVQSQKNMQFYTGDQGAVTAFQNAGQTVSFLQNLNINSFDVTGLAPIPAWVIPMIVGIVVAIIFVVLLTWLGIWLKKSAKRNSAQYNLNLQKQPPANGKNGQFAPLLLTKAQPTTPKAEEPKATAPAPVINVAVPNAPQQNRPQVVIVEKEVLVEKPAVKAAPAPRPQVVVIEKEVLVEKPTVRKTAAKPAPRPAANTQLIKVAQPAHRVSAKVPPRQPAPKTANPRQVSEPLVRSQMYPVYRYDTPQPQQPPRPYPPQRANGHYPPAHANAYAPQARAATNVPRPPHNAYGAPARV